MEPSPAEQCPVIDDVERAPPRHWPVHPEDFDYRQHSAVQESVFAITGKKLLIASE